MGSTFLQSFMWTLLPPQNPKGWLPWSTPWDWEVVSDFTTWFSCRKDCSAPGFTHTLSLAQGARWSRALMHNQHLWVLVNFLKQVPRDTSCHQRCWCPTSRFFHSCITPGLCAAWNSSCHQAWPLAPEDSPDVFSIFSTIHESPLRSKAAFSLCWNTGSLCLEEIFYIIFKPCWGIIDK